MPAETEKQEKLKVHTLYVLNQLILTVKDNRLTDAELQKIYKFIRRYFLVYKTAHTEHDAADLREYVSEFMSGK